VNLYLRFLIVFIRALFKPRMATLDTSILRFRVLPNDLDLNRHMNNGRYLSIMDLGRIDLMTRIGLFTLARKNRWLPVVGTVHMRYRRPLKLFQAFELQTRIVYWDEKWVFIEQAMISRGKICALGTVQGLIRAKDGNVPTSFIMRELGMNDAKPPMTDDVNLMEQFKGLE
jgi:acyl-CoA thioesterase FadM